MRTWETDLPLHLFHHGENFKTYELMGAHPATQNRKRGYVFRVWAPRAESVSVLGAFNNWDENAHVISRIVYFVENHWNELLKFSRRTEENINRWASRYGILTTAQDTYKNAKSRRLGRYVAVNLENCDTVEFRLFRGTLNYKTFVATLQIIDEICTHAINLSDKEVEGLSWSNFAAMILPKKTELIEYLKAKRLYVNEPIEEAEVI